MPKSKPGPAGPKQPFVPKEDRPEVKISLDTPLNELHVRELGAILGFLATKDPNFEVGKTSLKDFFDKDFPEVAKDWIKDSKSEKVEKPEKPEKIEKNEKFEKDEKHEKIEKREKSEFKDLKAEKIERDGVFEPTGPLEGDPLVQQVIQAVAGLTRQVSELANQVEALRKKVDR